MKETVLAALKTQWNRLLKEGQDLSFRKGQVLCYEGHNPYGIFVVQPGALKFSQEGDPCAVEHIWKTAKGEVIGLNHFLEGTPFCCTCIAARDCHVVFISKTQLIPFAPKITT